MSVVLIPLIKDKKANTSNIDYYRPVAIASVVSKVIERILLDRLSEYLDRKEGRKEHIYFDKTTMYNTSLSE